jgi:hypothetical protein
MTIRATRKTRAITKVREAAKKIKLHSILLKRAVTGAFSAGIDSSARNDRSEREEVERVVLNALFCERTSNSALRTRSTFKTDGIPGGARKP